MIARAVARIRLSRPIHVEIPQLAPGSLIWGILRGAAYQCGDPLKEMP